MVWYSFSFMLARRSLPVLLFALCLLLAAWISSCIEARCLDDEDCAEGETCSPDGRCLPECIEDEDCPFGFVCENNRCKAPNGPPIECPEDMVAVANAFCVDRYQASRPDATATSAGTDGSMAVSAENVIPWDVASNEVAQAACEAAGKRLCSPPEWRIACRGPDDTEYSYGDEYDPTACNGIDAFCHCDDPACADLDVCPYPRCFNQPSATEDGGPCDAAFRIVPTGTFERCTNGWGVFDINGNLWEHVAGGSNMTIRGGAFNCADSPTLHRCDYVPGNWEPTARGFRCCLSPD